MTQLNNNESLKAVLLATWRYSQSVRSMSESAFDIYVQRDESSPNCYRNAFDEVKYPRSVEFPVEQSNQVIGELFPRYMQMLYTHWSYYSGAKHNPITKNHVRVKKAITVNFCER